MTPDNIVTLPATATRIAIVVRYFYHPPEL
jgi:hypothetical protein